MFCCRVESCSWVVNWHIIPDTVGLRSEWLPCPETAAPHSVQKTSKWGLITLPCWILPSNSTFVLVVSAKSPNYVAEAFHPACVELCRASEMCMTDVSFFFFWKESVRRKKTQDWMKQTRVPSLQMTIWNIGFYETSSDQTWSWMCGCLKGLILYPFIDLGFLCSGAALHDELSRITP